MPRLTALILLLALSLAGCIPETSSSIADKTQKLDPNLAGDWTVTQPDVGKVALRVSPVDDGTFDVTIRINDGTPERFQASSAGANDVANLAELTRSADEQVPTKLPNRFVIGYRLADQTLLIYVPRSPPLKSGATADELHDQLQEVDVFADAPLIFDREAAPATR